MTVDYEKLGLLYLGGELSADGTPPASKPYLLPSKDLVTHGVIVGMTGSGKTGLGAVLLEEAAIDGIPAIVIDPKGDLGNLLLTFPSLSPEAFAPWVPVDDNAAAVAVRTRDGLAQWNQEPARIGLFENAVERAIYTPGSSAGRKLSIMGSFDRPTDDDAIDADETRRARAVSLTSSLLSLAGLDVDPVQSPEHVLVSSVLLHLWSVSPKTDLGQLLAHIQNPPFARIGMLETDSVAPPAMRQSIAMRLNTAFASPALQGFLDGEPLDIEKLLYNVDGKPRMSIITLAHLSDELRMFFVTILLNELLSWTRRQPGTSSLRALLYMDEVAGYLPPVKAPPSKAPIMTLLKQARAYGVGCVLATQNPVDVDYKALANAGVWYLGRLQTERDKARVLEGLEGNASATGGVFNKDAVDAALSSLPKRAFYAHNVHAKSSTTFTTRYALSYLRGPLTPQEVRKLNNASTPTTMMAAVNITPPAKASASASSSSSSLSATSSAPPVPSMVQVRFAGTGTLSPWLWAKTSLHYVHNKSGTDTWQTRYLLVPFVDDNPDFDAAVSESEPVWLTTATAPSSSSFAPLPPACARDKSWESWRKTVITSVVKSQPLVLLSSAVTEVTSKPGESKSAFIQRVAQRARELRDDEVTTLTTKWAPKIARAQAALKKAEEKVDALGSKRTAQTVSTGVDIGMSVLGALFGTRRSVASAAGRAVKSVSKQATSGGALDAAKAAVDDATEALVAVEAEAQAAVAEAQQKISSGAAQVEEVSIAAKKTEVTVEVVGLLWR